MYRNMNNLSSSKIANALIGFAALAGGAILAQSHASGCPSNIAPGTYCCAYPDGQVAASGGSTPSANACCIDCSGTKGQMGWKKIAIGGKISFCRAITYDASRYPFAVTNNKGKTCVFTSPCSSNCL